MNQEEGGFFKSSVDATPVYRTMARQSWVIGACFVLPSLAFIFYWLTHGWPDVSGYGLLVAAIPFCAIASAFVVIWRQTRPLFNRPIVRRTTVEDGWLVQVQESVGRKHLVERASRVPLDGRTVAFVSDKSIMLRSRGGDDLRMIGMPKDEFLSEASFNAFVNFLRENGVQHTTSMATIVLGRSETQRRLP